MLYSLRIIHNKWMDVLYDRHTNPHPVFGRYNELTSFHGAVLYNLWRIIGYFVILPVYILLLFGYVTKIFITDKIHAIVSHKNIWYPFFLLSATFITLTVISYRYSTFGGAVAVGLSGLVGILSATIAYIVWRRFGRLHTVLIVYPLVYNAILLPPIVFSVVHSTLGTGILEISTDLVISFNENILSALGLQRHVESVFDLTRNGHIIVWFIISVISGWISGVSVSFFSVLQRHLSE